MEYLICSDRSVMMHIQLYVSTVEVLATVCSS